MTGAELAAAIGPGLAKAAAVMEVDGELQDLDRELPDGARVRFIRYQDEAALPVIRHDCAHVMAEAVQDLYPGTQVTIGPPIEDGFYYDFARNEPFTPEDLARIEARMAEIVAADQPFRREVGEPRRGEAALRGAGRELQAASCSTTSRRTSRSRSTTRATGSISAAGRTGRRPGGSARSS